MRRIKFVLIVLLNVVIATSWAQERGDYQFSNFVEEYSQSEMIEIDTTLFRMPINLYIDSYQQAIQYYNIQGATRRRGLYYSTAECIVEPSKEYFQILKEPLEQSKLTLYSAQSGYRAAMSAYHAQQLSTTWTLSSSIWAQTGRDMFIKGVFRNTVSPQITLSKRYGEGHFLSIDAELYCSTRGMQSSSTNEAFSLVGSNYYNPSWGFYDGKVRNSHVRRYFIPTISTHYQQPLGENNTIIIDGKFNYTRSANSALGWYNATTPTPDYYRKMPSFFTEGDTKDFVTNIWRTNSTDYTQINWDELVRLNSLSTDGNAFYVLEDRVKQESNLDLAAMLHSNIGSRLTLTYGVVIKLDNSRYFKKMRDLLGATHLMDYDTFLSDSYNKTLPLQNNLQNPENNITQGDRFGYDYSQIDSKIDAIFRASYRASRFDFNIDATIGGEALYRVGHFEKERFASSASFGESTKINISPYNIRASIGYALRSNKYFALKLVSSRLSPQSRNLFLNETTANYLAPSLNGELINSAACAFKLNYPRVTLSGEIYILRSREGSSVYSLYDDLTSTMCRASITDIGYCSYGIELAADIKLHSDLKLTTTLAAGRYYYDKTPYIELFDEYSLTTISSPTASRINGINIGNAPQIAATASLAYFGLSRYIFNVSSSYAGLRYSQPSIVRRSERLFNQAFLNEECAEEAMKQHRLDDIFDVEISAMRLLWFNNGHRLTIRASIRNLLGDNDRIIYAKESDRITLQRADNYFSGATMRESMWQYGTPRTIRLSIGYLF